MACKERQDLRRVVCTCESPMSPNHPKALQIFATLSRMEASRKQSEPMGEPRRQKPELVIGISEGRVLLHMSSPGGNVEERLATIQTQPPREAFLLDNPQGYVKVLWSATERAIVQVPGTAEQIKHFPLSSLNNWLKSDYKT